MWSPCDCHVTVTCSQLAEAGSHRAAHTQLSLVVQELCIGVDTHCSSKSQGTDIESYWNRQSMCTALETISISLSGLSICLSVSLSGQLRSFQNAITCNEDNKTSIPVYSTADDTVCDIMCTCRKVVLASTTEDENGTWSVTLTTLRRTEKQTDR